MANLILGNGKPPARPALRHRRLSFGRSQVKNFGVSFDGCWHRGKVQVLKVGDRVRVIGIPERLPPDGDDLNTSSLFERCLGRVFSIVAFDQAGHAELAVGEMDGRRAYLTSIWIEPEHLRVETPVT